MARSSRQGPSESLDLYLEEIRDHPLLEREEEVELARRIRAGDEEALNRLVASNLRFVVAVARRYAGHGIPMADLVTEGNLGLLKAARRFDETKGVRFVSYAVWWIRQAMLRTISESGRIVRVPSTQTELASRVSRAAQALRQRLDREPTETEIAAEADLGVDEVREALVARSGYVSLDAPVQDAEDTSLLDLLPDPSGDETDLDVQRTALHDLIEEGLTRLPEREARILRLYFGLDGEGPRTLEEIARELGVSRERIRAMKDRALVRLRLGETGRILSGFRRR
jgi:RNA polymerase primary sigma factor